MSVLVFGEILKDSKGLVLVQRRFLLFAIYYDLALNVVFVDGDGAILSDVQADQTGGDENGVGTLRRKGLLGADFDGHFFVFDDQFFGNRLALGFLL